MLVLCVQPVKGHAPDLITDELRDHEVVPGVDPASAVQRLQEENLTFL